MMMSKEEIETIAYVIFGVVIAYWITKNWRVFLRDYFAAKAMQAMLNEDPAYHQKYQFIDLADFSYQCADAMLKARKA